MKNYLIPITRLDERLYNICDFKLLDTNAIGIYLHKYSKHLLDIEKTTKFLLESDLKIINLENIQKKYDIFLRYHGYKSPKGKVDQIGLQSAFIKYYGDFTDYLNCTIDLTKWETWLNMITRNRIRVFRPLYHILLINFLSTAEDFFNTQSIILQMNFHDQNIEKKKLLFREDVKEYLIINPQASRSQLTKDLCSARDFLSKYDAVWFEANIPKSSLNNRSDEKSLITSKNRILDFIGNNPGCNRTTVRSYLRNEYEQCRQYDINWLDINIPAKRENKNLDKKRIEYRNKLISYINDHANYNRVQIFRNYKKVYNWLYLNDINWLN